MSINLAIFSGNVGKNAELRYTASGTAQATFSLAVNNGRKKPDGTWEDNTTWVNCVLWREAAERLSPSIVKGTPVVVQGRIQERNWTDNDGVKHFRWELICDRVEIHGKRPKQGEQGESEAGDLLPWE